MMEPCWGKMAEIAYSYCLRYCSSALERIGAIAAYSAGFGRTLRKATRNCRN